MRSEDVQVVIRRRSHGWSEDDPKMVRRWSDDGGWVAAVIVSFIEGDVTFARATGNEAASKGWPGTALTDFPLRCVDMSSAHSSFAGHHHHHGAHHHHQASGFILQATAVRL